MAPKVAYRVIYFKFQALGEPIRWLLSYANEEFEDVRVSIKEWVEYQKETPYGKLPLLEVNGEILWQHQAICRWIARKVGLTGKSDWDALKIDILIDTIIDLRGHIAKYHYDTNPETKELKREPLQTETIPYFMARFENIVKENNGHFVNGQLTWADLYFSSLIEYYNEMAGMDILEGCPTLSLLYDKVRNIPQIKNWIDKRSEDEEFAPFRYIAT